MLVLGKCRVCLQVICTNHSANSSLGHRQARQPVWLIRIAQKVIPGPCNHRVLVSTRSFKQNSNDMTNTKTKITKTAPALAFRVIKIRDWLIGNLNKQSKKCWCDRQAESGIKPATERSQRCCKNTDVKKQDANRVHTQFPWPLP